MKNFVQAIIAFSLKNRFIVFFMTFLLLGVGIVSYIHTPIEAFPDVTNTRARIITQCRAGALRKLKSLLRFPFQKR